jgi:hypothetical protein
MITTANHASLYVFDPEPVKEYSMGIYTQMKPSVGNPEVYVCIYTGQTLEALVSEGKVSPEAFLCPLEEAAAKSRDLARQRLCKGPQRVTRERWWELLEVLFPARWENTPEGEIFMVPECITSCLYTFGVRIGEDYFSITEDCDIEAAKLIAMCKEAMS